jgi:hypothetical protein
MSDRVASRLLWEAGRRARAEGRTHLEGPHRLGSDEWAVWFMGWRGDPHPAVQLSHPGPAGR